MGLCMLLFLGVYRTVQCSVQLKGFVGLPHTARIRLSPELQPCAGAVQVELTRRQSWGWLSIIPWAKSHHGKPLWFVLWLLLAACDVEWCPGPRYSEYLCVVCRTPVVSEGIWCNACHKWCHPKRAWVSDEEYQRLGNSPDDWFCPACCLPSFTSSLFESPEEKPGCSPSKSTPAIDHKLKILYTNCRSPFPKLDSLRAAVATDSPAVIALTVSWLDKDIGNTEIAVPGYQSVRRDRNRHGGGIILYIKDNISLSTPQCHDTFELLSCSWNQPSPSQTPTNSILSSSILYSWRPVPSRVISWDHPSNITLFSFF